MALEPNRDERGPPVGRIAMGAILWVLRSVCKTQYQLIGRRSGQDLWARSSPWTPTGIGGTGAAAR